VPRGFNDSELDFLIDNAVRPLAADFNPGALVITCGADGLSGDPLSRLALSNVGLWKAVENLLEICDRTVVLGGGGYNPWTVVRCWGGLWGRLSGREIPASLPRAARALLQNFECDLIDEDEIPGSWISNLADQANIGPVRDQVEKLPGLVLN
jgi:acetoin utilization protein AcuC